MMKKVFVFCISLLLTPVAFAAIPYCKTSQPLDAQEGPVIQALVTKFAQQMGCEVGANCLKKLGHDVFSVAWKDTCGPIIDGRYQLGDNGHGSLFECGMFNSTYCCWPKGYQRSPYIRCQQ